MQTSASLNALSICLMLLAHVFLSNSSDPALIFSRECDGLLMPSLISTILGGGSSLNSSSLQIIDIGDRTQAYGPRFAFAALFVSFGKAQRHSGTHLIPGGLRAVIVVVVVPIVDHQFHMLVSQVFITCVAWGARNVARPTP